MMRYLLVLAWACLGSSFSPGAGYTISGIAVANATGKPLKHILITIATVRRHPRTWSCVTGADGRFLFTNVPAGKFTLSAERSDSPPELFREHDVYSTAIVTGPGISSENIRFPITVQGSISGKVNDEQGDPVPEAHMILFNRGVVSGKWDVSVGQQGQTNSSGEFYFESLTPGTYLLAADALPWYSQDLGTAGIGTPAGSEFDVAYPITYYGDTTDPNAASPITVTEGESTTVELTLRPEPAAHVQIFKAGGKTGSIGWNIYGIGPNGMPILANLRFMIGSNQEQTAAIAPGRYIFESSPEGRKIVTVDGDSTLHFTASPSGSISGRVTFEGGSPGAEQRVLLASEVGSVQANVLPDGSFDETGLAPGRYEVRLPQTNPYYVRSVTLEGRDAPVGQIEVSDGSKVQVSVLIGKGVFTVDGIATKDGAPLAGALILLMPNDFSRTSLVRRDQSDSDGTFTLADVAPGRYTLLAIDDGRDLEYMDANVIRPYLEGGQEMNVPVHGQVKINVLARRR